MDSLGDLLNQKATAIQLDEKRQEISIAQSELERFFDNSKANIAMISDKTVTVKVRSSVMASEVRLSQINLLKSLTKALDREITRIYIKTGLKL
jgi:hypothetical protein